MRMCESTKINEIAELLMSARADILVNKNFVTAVEAINIALDETTKLKLTIFGECFKEWLPVFLHDKHTQSVYIYDFFAGSGTDAEGHPGSPLILLNEAKGEERKYCQKAHKKISFLFTE